MKHDKSESIPSQNGNTDWECFCYSSNCENKLDAIKNILDSDLRPILQHITAGVRFSSSLCFGIIILVHAQQLGTRHSGKQLSADTFG